MRRAPVAMASSGRSAGRVGLGGHGGVVRRRRRAPSGAQQVRAAASRAVGVLLANVKRMNAASSRETSLRRHFLRLAGWFDEATPHDAHVLYTSAFALYGARHLGVTLEPAIAEALPATTSWWDAPPAPVPMSIRERGDRNPRGRVVRVSDHGAQKDRLLDERRRDDEQRAAAIAELAAVGDRLAEVRLSAPAMTVVLELLGLATARFGPDLAGTTAALVDAPLTLWIEPNDGAVTLSSPIGDLTVHGFRIAVIVTGDSQPGPATWRAGRDRDDDRRHRT